MLRRSLRSRLSSILRGRRSLTANFGELITKAKNDVVVAVKFGRVELHLLINLLKAIECATGNLIRGLGHGLGLALSLSELEINMGEDIVKPVAKFVSVLGRC